MNLTFQRSQQLFIGPNLGFVLSFAGVRAIRESHENRTNKPRFRLSGDFVDRLLGKAIS
jgi:hypothetical protein